MMLLFFHTLLSSLPPEQQQAAFLKGTHEAQSLALQLALQSRRARLPLTPA